MAGKIKVPSELVPSQYNKIMLRSKYIYDDVKGKTQETVNSDLNSKIDTKAAELNQKIDSKVIEAGAVPYDNKPTANSTNIMQSQHIKTAIENYTGYFVLDNNIVESDVNKTVTANDKFVLPANGGSIKILMHCRNTATNPTLNINGTGPKPIWYNGAAASASNSWDANEVISVYYDGTRYQASNAQGGSNTKIDAYLYGDLRTLAIGQTYNVDEAVKTTDSQLFRVTKEVKAMNLFDAVATGDLVAIASGTYLGTYKAQKAVNNYSNSTTYTDGAYAIGCPAKQVITVDISGRASEIAEGSAIVVTVNGTAHSISITSEKTAAQIASELSSAIGNIGGWTKTYSENEDSITLKCNIAGVNTISFSFSDPNETGVVVSNTVSAGTTILCQYDETNDSWSTVSISDYASNSVAIGDTDATKMWQKLDITGLTAYTSQNTIDSELIKSYKTELKLVGVSLQQSLYANASTAGNNFGLTYSDSSKNWGVSGFINVEDCESISIYTTLRDSSARKNVVGGVFYTDAKNNNSCAMTAGAWVMPGNSYAVGWKTLLVPEGARYFRTSCGLSKGSTVYYLTKKESLAETTKQVYDFSDSLIPLSLGAIYQKGNVVKDDNGNLFRFTKTIEFVNTTDKVSIGDVKVQGSNTYKALKNISTYSATVARSSSSYPYSAGSYAVGRPSIHTITVTADTVTAGNVTLTVGNISRIVAISAGESVADIVSSIATAITGVVSYWVVTTAGNVITLECKKTITNALNFAFTDTDSTGVNVSVSKVGGAETVSKYDGSNWVAVTVSNLVSDLSMFEKVDKDWILSHICEPEYNNYSVNIFDISKESVGPNNNNTTVKKTETGFRCTCLTHSLQGVGYISIHGLTPGRYKISFNSSFSNVINADVNVQAGFLRIKNGNAYNSTTLWSYCVTLNQGTLTSYFTCTTSSVLYFAFHNTDLRNANSWIELSNIKIQKASSYQTEINDINSRIEALNNNIKVPTSYTGTYIGKEIDLGHNTHYYSMRNSYTNVIDAQALAIYGNYMIRISNGSQPVNKNKAALYYLNDDGTTSLIWKVDLNADHANSAQFGTSVAPNSTFPYLYVSSLDNPACYVYRITLDGTIEKVQTIRTSLPKGRNFQCGDDGFIYYYSAWIVAKYPLPAVSSGDVTLTDAIEDYATGYKGASTGQGGLIHDGKIYCPVGGYSVTDRRLVVIDLTTHRFLTEIVFDGIIPATYEPEDVDIRDDELYIGSSQNNKGLYIIKFIQ